MGHFGEPIDIKQFAADLMSLTSGDIEELTKELKEHWWKDFTTEDVAITPDTLMAWAHRIGKGNRQDESRHQSANRQVVQEVRRT